VGAEDLFHRPELQSCIVAPSGQVVAQAFTAGDEVIVTWDLDWCQRYATTIFDFDRYPDARDLHADNGQRGADYAGDQQDRR
jgi:hypothetical protein